MHTLVMVPINTISRYLVSGLSYNPERVLLYHPWRKLEFRVEYSCVIVGMTKRRPGKMVLSCQVIPCAQGIYLRYDSRDAGAHERPCRGIGDDKDIARRTTGIPIACLIIIYKRNYVGTLVQWRRL